MKKIVLIVYCLLIGTYFQAPSKKVSGCDDSAEVNTDMGERGRTLGKFHYVGDLASNLTNVFPHNC